MVFYICLQQLSTVPFTFVIFRSLSLIKGFIDTNEFEIIYVCTFKGSYKRTASSSQYLQVQVEVERLADRN